MDRGAWQATGHMVPESDKTEHVHTHTHTQGLKVVSVMTIISQDKEHVTVSRI